MICTPCKEIKHEACPGKLYCDCQHVTVMIRVTPPLWGKPVE